MSMVTLNWNLILILIVKEITKKFEEKGNLY